MRILGYGVLSGLVLVAGIAIAGEQYDRKDWGRWSDADGDCQNLRAELLIAQSHVPVTFRGDKTCVVATGEWIGPYSGKAFTSASQVDIDHVVPLYEAHLSGGWAWTRAQKRDFANDPDNLLIVDKGLNRAKGAKDPARWLDVRPAYQCAYLKKWQAIKKRYGLDVDAREKGFIAEKMKNC